MRLLTATVLACVLAGCCSCSSTPRSEPHVNATEEVSLQPRLYMKILPSRGLEHRTASISIAMWDDGLLVWDASADGSPLYLCQWLSAQERQQLERSVTNLDLVDRAPSAHSVPSSGFIEIAVATRDRGERTYAWDERPTSLDRNSGSFVGAWNAARKTLESSKPSSGRPLHEDATAAERFRARFPGFVIPSA